MTRTQIKQLSRRTTSRVRREERGSGRPGPGRELKPCPGETSHRQRPQTRRSQREEPEEHPRPRGGALNPTIPNPPQGAECEAPLEPPNGLITGLGTQRAPNKDTPEGGVFQPPCVEGPGCR